MPAIEPYNNAASVSCTVCVPGTELFRFGNQVSGTDLSMCSMAHKTLNVSSIGCTILIQRSPVFVPAESICFTANRTHSTALIPCTTSIPGMAPVQDANQVSGTSLFWCLTTLALCCMMQPSALGTWFSKDLFKDALWPHRSSPFICIADTVSDLVNSTKLQSLFGKKHEDRSNLERDAQEESKPVGNVVVLMRLFAFVFGVVPQAIQMFSMRGIFGTQILAAMFTVAATVNLLCHVRHGPDSVSTSERVIAMRDEGQSAHEEPGSLPDIAIWLEPFATLAHYILVLRVCWSLAPHLLVSSPVLVDVVRLVTLLSLFVTVLLPFMEFSLGKLEIVDQIPGAAYALAFLMQVFPFQVNHGISRNIGLTTWYGLCVMVYLHIACLGFVLLLKTCALRLISKHKPASAEHASSRQSILVNSSNVASRPSFDITDVDLAADYRLEPVQQRNPASSTENSERSTHAESSFQFAHGNTDAHKQPGQKDTWSASLLVLAIVIMSAVIVFSIGKFLYNTILAAQRKISSHWTQSKRSLVSVHSQTWLRREINQSTEGVTIGDDGDGDASGDGEHSSNSEHDSASGASDDGEYNDDSGHGEHSEHREHSGDSESTIPESRIEHIQINTDAPEQSPSIRTLRHRQMRSSGSPVKPLNPPAEPLWRKLPSYLVQGPKNYCWSFGKPFTVGLPVLHTFVKAYSAVDGWVGFGLMNLVLTSIYYLYLFDGRGTRAPNWGNLLG